MWTVKRGAKLASSYDDFVASLNEEEKKKFAEAFSWFVANLRLNYHVIKSDQSVIDEIAKNDILINIPGSCDTLNHNIATANHNIAKLMKTFEKKTSTILDGDFISRYGEGLILLGIMSVSFVAAIGGTVGLLAAAGSGPLVGAVVAAHLPVFLAGLGLLALGMVIALGVLSYQQCYMTPRDMKAEAVKRGPNKKRGTFFETIKELDQEKELGDQFEFQDCSY